MKISIHSWSYLVQFFLEWEMFRTKVLESIKTRILYSITSSQKHAVYEIMYTEKNIVEPDRPQYSTCALHAGYLWLQTHTKDM